MKSITGRAKLAATLQKRMHDTNVFNSTESVELGKITGSGGIKLDNFPDVIPKGDYMICKPPVTITSTQDGDSGEITTEQEISLKSGDRVLVVWASGEPVVVGIVESS